jgi:lambda family phage tail tape measure protein
MSDSFTAFLAELGKATGLTTAYTGIIKELTVAFNQFAGVATLRDVNLDELFEGVRAGATKASDAIEEVKRRQLELADIGLLDLLVFNEKAQGQLSGANQKTREQLAVILTQLQTISAEQQITADKAAKTTEEYKAQKEAIATLFKDQGLQKFVTALNELEGSKTFEKLGTPLEQLNIKLLKAKDILQGLGKAQSALKAAGLDKDSLGKVSDEYQQISNGIEDVTKYITDLNRQVEESDGITTFTEYWKELMEEVRTSADKTANGEQALIRLKEELANGTISLENYNIALTSVNEELDKTDKALARAQSKSADFIAELEYGSKDAQLEFNKLNMNPLERQVASLKNTMSRDLAQVIAEIERARTPANSAEITAEIEKVKKASEDAFKSQAEYLKKTRTQQRSFSFGWQQAFDDYVDAATNAGKQAGDIFAKTTQGMEDAIVDFAKTGKFEWKGFVSSIVEELLRAQVKQLIASTFGGLGLGGGQSKSNTGSGLLGLGGLFGFLADGGPALANKPYIVGERGPELFVPNTTGTVVPNEALGGSGTYVTYNINAVDAMSFKQMVARDPSFIYAVSQQGAKAIPNRR